MKSVYEKPTANTISDGEKLDTVLWCCKQDKDIKSHGFCPTVDGKSWLAEARRGARALRDCEGKSGAVFIHVSECVHRKSSASYKKTKEEKQLLN